MAAFGGLGVVGGCASGTPCRCGYNPPPRIVRVTGCQMGVGGATVDVYSDPGYSTLVDSATTDDDGNTLISAPSTGTYYFRVTPPSGLHYATYTNALWLAGYVWIKLSPDSSHTCWGACADPIATSQPFEDSQYGSATATYDASYTLPGGATVPAFVVEKSVDYPGSADGGCPASSGVSATWVFVEAGLGARLASIGWQTAGGPYDVCPDGSGVGYRWQTFAVGGFNGVSLVDALTSCDPFCYAGRNIAASGAFGGVYSPLIYTDAPEDVVVKLGASSCPAPTPRCDPAASLTVCVVDACDGDPVPGAAVYFYPSNPSIIGMATTDGSGCATRYTAAPGVYYYEANFVGYYTSYGSISVSCSGPNSDTIEITPSICGTPCDPCALPNGDMTLSWTNSGLGGDDSAALAYSPSGPVWQGDCTASGLDSIRPALACEDGVVSPIIEFWSGSTSCAASTSAGPKYAASCVDGGGGSAWSNPSYAKSADGSYATCSIGSGSTNSLAWSDFGFSIPSGSTILGLKAEIYGSSSNEFAGDSVFYWRSGGSDRGTDHGIGMPFSDFDSTLVFGGPTDLGGASWTPAQINDSTFGLRFGCSAGRSSTFSVDYARVTVYYTSPTGTYSVASGDLTAGSSTCTPLSLAWFVKSSSPLYTSGFRTFTATL